MKKLNLPQHEIVKYVLNSEIGYYYTSKEFDHPKDSIIMRLPGELKLAAGCTIFHNADGVIFGVTNTEPSKTFLVNLYHTYFFHWFVGVEWTFFAEFPYFGTMLFNFCSNSRNLLIYYFPTHQCYNLKQLLTFADSAIPDLQRLDWLEATPF